MRRVRQSDTNEAPNETDGDGTASGGEALWGLVRFTQQDVTRLNSLFPRQFMCENKKVYIVQSYHLRSSEWRQLTPGKVKAYQE